MEAIDSIKQNLRDGRIDIDRWMDLFTAQQRQLDSAKRELDSAKQRIQELEQQLRGAATAKLDEPFSMPAEEKRQEKQHKKKRKRPQGRRGRLKTADKIQRAERIEKVFPEGVLPHDCRLSHTRPVWLLESGRAVLVA